MAQSVLCLISGKGAAGVSNWISRKGVAGCSNWISRRRWGSLGSRVPDGSDGSRMIGTMRVSDRSVSRPPSSFAPRSDFLGDGYVNCPPSLAPRWNFSGVSDGSVLCPSSLSSTISPWLMLPPVSEGGSMVYKFYSLSERKVLSVDNRGGGSSSSSGDKDLNYSPDGNAKFVGSSHGWLALFNKSNCDLILSNPLSRRQVKLPPIHTLTIPESNLRYGSGCVSNLIISCSPAEEEDCRAMITYGPSDRLAFCCPGRSTEWTPVGGDGSVARMYQSFVYSSKQKIFFCVTQYTELEAWDLCDPESPKLIPMDVSVHEKNCPWYEDSELTSLTMSFRSLVISEQSDELFLVKRFVLHRVGPDGSYVEDVYYDQECRIDDSVPYKTVGFDVYKYDPKDGTLRYMDGSLDGLSMFIGSNHSFAMSAADFPELKPNSIYFTDLDILIPMDNNLTYGGHDIGIFNYENKTLSPCYYPCEVQSIKRIVPAPMWFTPTPL